LFYNFISIITLIPAIIYAKTIKEEPFFVWNGNLFFLKIFILSLAALLFISGFKHYSISEFFGFRQIKEGISNKAISKTGKLDTCGILGIIRHPFYTATFLFFWSSNLDTANLIINVIISFYLVIGTILEERKLIIEFGKSYIDYKKKVSMFFPFKWIKEKSMKFLK
jgi:protein-S-isoprenylcysteine O-methyltransferase Ste14